MLAPSRPDPAATFFIVDATGGGFSVSREKFDGFRLFGP
jgi:hypothetical protein